MHAWSAAFKKSNILMASVVLLYGSTAVAAWKDYVKTPPCAMNKDPAAVFPVMSLCLTGTAGTWMEQRSKVDEDIQPPHLISSRGSATFLFTSWLSVRAEGYALIFQDRATGKTVSREARPETTLVQLGNTSTHRHRLFAGKGRMPFGLNLNVDKAWSNPLRFDSFFGEAIKIVGYTYDNQQDWTVTLSGGTAENIDSQAKRRQSALGVRIMYDLAALEGTRLVASFATDELEHRRGEVGAVNVNGKGDITAFEVIRIWSNFPFDPQDFSQLIRLSWSGSTYERIAPHGQYEDQLGVRRIGTLGIKFNAKKNMDLTVTTGYCKDESGDGRNYWLGVAGAEVHL